MKTVDFLRPRMRGPRFEGASIPLELLKDLAVIEEMVIEVAKWRFLQEHPERQRCPRGFTDGIELRLTGVDEGSAIPQIVMAITLANLPGMLTPSEEYFEQAREAIVLAIAAADQNQPVTTVPVTCLGYFDRLGRSLRDGECIELSSTSQTAPARLTKESRRTLLLASQVQELTEAVSLRGTIPEVNQAAMTFTLQMRDGRAILGPMPEQHLESIIEAFKGYRAGVRVQLQGIGRFDRQNRLLRLELVEHLSLLHPLDVAARLDELRGLEDGWLEGRGVAPRPEGLTWLAERFEAQYPDELQPPRLFPTPEGGMQAEWQFAPHDLSLDIELSSHRGAWYVLNLETDAEDVRELDLDDEEAWRWLATEIRRLEGGVA